MKLSGGTIKWEGKPPLRIVGDACIANADRADGRMVPLVILDTSDRPEVDEFIRLHQYISVGDTRLSWGQLFSKKNSVILFLRAIRPLEFDATIEFDLARNHGILVEWVLASRALYIQAGREGDRLKHDLERPKVIAEVPDLGFRADWDRIYLQHTTSTMRAMGIPRSEARRLAKKSVSETKKIALFRAFTT